MADNEFAFNYRMDIASCKNTHWARNLNELPGSFPNPVEVRLQSGIPYSGNLKVRALESVGLMECCLSSPASDASFTEYLTGQCLRERFDLTPREVRHTSTAT